MKDILIQYIPYITSILTFLAAGVGFIMKMGTILKKNNIDEIKESLIAHEDEIVEDIDNLKGQLQHIIDDNRALRQLNLELLRELKRISDYEPEEEV